MNETLSNKYIATLNYAEKTLLILSGASSIASLCPLLMSLLHLFIALLARSKLNNIEKVISKALIDFDISHDKFTVVTNEQ